MRKFVKIIFIFVLIITSFSVISACKQNKTFVEYKNATIDLGDKGKVDSYKLYLKEGERFALITPAQTITEGKKFIGWEDEEGHHYVAGEQLNMGKASKTFTAVWQTAYTFVFLKNAPDATGEEPATMYYAQGEVFRLPFSPYTREGYRFEGWTETEGSDLLLGNSKYTVQNKNTEFNAVWTRIYSVNFLSGAKTGQNVSGSAPVITPRESGQSIKLPQCSFRISGYEFTGWTVDEDVYNVGDTYTVTEDVTFTAMWEKSSTTSDENFSYLLNADNESYSIAKSPHTTLPQNLVLPDTYQDKPITAIADRGFYQSSALLSVTISKNITRIGEEAFYSCAKLETVILQKDNNLREINKSAFENCVKLSSFGLSSQPFGALNLPDAVTVLDEYAFFNCGFIKINIHAFLEEIKTCALARNALLTSFEVADQNLNFRGNITLTDKNITVLYAYALANTAESFSTGNIVSIKPYALYGAKKLKTMTYGASLTTVGAFAFAYCENMTEIIQTQTAANKLTTVGEYAFLGCSKLQSFYIGKILTNIDFSAFYGCIRIGEYICDADNASFSVVEKDWYNKDRTRLIAYAPNKSSKIFDLPDTVQVIGSFAFAYSGVEKVTASSNTALRVIEDSAFESCSSLTSFYNFSFLTSIGDYAFAYCSSLTSATLGSQLSCLGKYAFYFCRNLTTLTVSSDCVLTEIFPYAFGESGLTSINIRGAITSINEGAFNGCANLKDINLGNVTTIKANAFKACNALEAITLPQSVSSIESTAFVQCPKLKVIVVQSGNTHFAADDNGNLYNKSITKLIAVSNANENNTHFILPATVTEIGDYAFYKTGIMTFSVHKDSMLTKIGKNAFELCTSLQWVAMPSSLTEISEKAFYDCPLLSSFTFSEQQQLQNIGSMAFGNCVKLRLVLSGTNIPAVDENAFNLSAQAQQSSFRPKIYVQNSLLDGLKAEWANFSQYLYPISELD